MYNTPVGTRAQHKSIAILRAPPRPFAADCGATLMLFIIKAHFEREKHILGEPKDGAAAAFCRRPEVDLSSST